MSVKSISMACAPAIAQQNSPRFEEVLGLVLLAGELFIEDSSCEGLGPGEDVATVDLRLLAICNWFFSISVCSRVCKKNKLGIAKPLELTSTEDMA